MSDTEAVDVAAQYRDLVSRLGFGDNITEPMADNDTIVAWFEERGREAAEWVESQLWRDECHLAGHPDDEDCYEHDPARRLEAAEAKVARCKAILDAWDAWDGSRGPDGRMHPDSSSPLDRARLRAALADPGDERGQG